MNSTVYAERLARMVSDPAPVATAPVPVRAITGRENRDLLASRGMTIKARFDNSLTTGENQQLWALSDSSSIDSAANYGTRRILRMRARYMYHNNPFVIGAANRLGKFVVGPGPKLHLGTNNEKANDAVEVSFAKWAKRVQLGRKLRVSRAARFYNGEGFNLLRTNPKIKHPVKLDVFEIECDRVTSPLSGIYPAQYPDQWFDGVTLDRWGNKENYQILRQHPGAFGAFLLTGTEFDNWPAQFVLHDYSRLRPEQQRGIPEATPALDLFEEARRYRKSVLAASETAADYAGWIETMAPTEIDPGASNQEFESGYGPQMDYVDIRRRQMGVLPGGAKAMQMKAEQPVTTYDSYMLSLMVEASQVLDMPLFILTGDARLANMSSAYVATQSFIKTTQTDREDYELLLDQVFEEWLAEARCIAGLIPDDLDDDPDHAWRWDRVATHADPSKMASAQNQRLKNGSRSPSIECADDGLEFEEVAKRSAQDYGVSIEEYKAALFQSTFAERGTPPPAAINDPEAQIAPSPGRADPVSTDDEDQ